MRYELYYWPHIQGRGEFVRLALEEAGADYVDVARLPENEGGGRPAIVRMLQDEKITCPPYAPPLLKAGEQIVFHTANILRFLGPQLGLMPADEPTQSWAHGLQLTITDFVLEAHDIHHPIAKSLYYDDQKTESLRRAPYFRNERLTKFLNYFETVLKRNGGHCMVGKSLSYVDLSMFQLIGGLNYAFPRAMEGLKPNIPLLNELHVRVNERPRIVTYLASPRRLPFSTNDVFRHYPELDA